MLRMALLGLLILFSVGVLSAMELSAPPRRVVVTVEPLAERSANISASYDASAKADRLEVAAASSAMPTEAASVENPGAPQDIHVRSPAPIVRHRPDPKTIAAAKPPKPKPKPKPIVVKRTANVQRAKAASETEPCRLKAFGGLLKALNLTRCEI
ncbi:outer membrane biosynthesis protein TonB [Bradyrhizobium sp. LM6.10]